MFLEKRKRKYIYERQEYEILLIRVKIFLGKRDAVSNHKRKEETEVYKNRIYNQKNRLSIRFYDRHLNLFKSNLIMAL